MSEIWLTADTHFGHRNILKFEPESRPFTDTDHMDEILISNWNSVVSPSDTVFHLGDAIMGDFEAGIRKMGRLNGEIFLIPGNHDRVFSGMKNAAYRDRFAPAYMSVFDDILDEQVTIDMNGQELLLCHFPYEGDSHNEDRYADKRPIDNGHILLHGHIHGSSRLSFTTKNTAQIHVGLDAWSLTPVHLDEILNILQNLP